MNILVFVYHDSIRWDRAPWPLVYFSAETEFTVEKFKSSLKSGKARFDVSSILEDATPEELREFENQVNKTRSQATGDGYFPGKVQNWGLKYYLAELVE